MDKRGINEMDREMLQKRLRERRLFLGLTYQDLADKTGISKSTLQRYESGGIKNLPYDKIFILSEALEVSPNYFTDLSKDYTDVPHSLDKPSNLYEMTKEEHRAAHLNMIKEFEEKALKLLSPGLIYNGYSVEQRDHGSVGDLVATSGNEVWHIDFMYTRDVNKYPVGMGMGRQQLLLRFGRLAVYDKPITKYSIVVDKRVIAEQLLQFKPVHLDIVTSILILRNDGFEELFFNGHGW